MRRVLLAKSDAQSFLKILRKHYPQAGCSLHHADPFQLLIATILSAQCTDERVNKVTPALFRKYPSPTVLARASKPQVEALIRSTGFYKNKALSIIESSKVITEKFGGKVPKTMEELLTLRGVARKTANVVLGNAYGISVGIVVDTHVKRLAFRMGLTKNTVPEKVEQDLMSSVPRDSWEWLSHALIEHGRALCMARKPQCAACPLNGICPKNGVQ
ncbi:MAG TPA: endonuclease III [Elusimicrobiales bacterium]|nr:endonuclease III [Elusimicrobiales bacterium]